MGRPTALVLDGAHNGDPEFFFLPPLVPDPSTDPNFDPAKFDATLAPTVEVCRLTGDPRSGPVFCVANAALVFGPVNAILDLTSQQYRVNWDTKSPTLLDPSQFYRIRVRGAAGKSVLGSLDVDPVDQGIKNLRSGDVVQFPDGRTLPIKFRIEQGERCTFNADCVTQVVGAGGAIIITSEAGGGVTGGAVAIPPDALDPGEEITVTISRLDRQPCLPQIDIAQFEGCFQFTADPPLSARTHNPGRFNTDVVVAICVELPLTITQAQEGLLQLHAFDAAQGVRALPNASAAFLPCEPNRFPFPPGGLGARPGWRGILDRVAAFAVPQPAYASMVHLGVGGSSCCFSDIGWALPAKMAVLAGDDQLAALGDAVATPPALLVTDANNAPVAGATVHFRIPSTGAGSVTPTQVVTGADGVARVDSWVLAAGTNSLEAFATGIGPTPTFPIVSGPLSEGVVTFTAAGVPPGTILVRPSSGGVTTQSGNSNVSLPLTQPSGLSMQSGTGIQLEFFPAVTVIWSSSDPTGTNASVNTTGLVAVAQENDDPTTAHEVVFSALAGDVVGSIKLNSFGFDHFRRFTTLVWRPVAGAATYDVEVDFGNGCTPDTAVCDSWTQQVSQTTSNLRFLFEFVGAQPGRWRVVPRNAAGAAMTPSEFVYFRYVI
ncbi:MAG: hypothetical protein DMD70_03720 [Gemmatimonadetes bacterium]|nr:MAG: hypothetical protein DMD70_03720 [Gemmatimonadota bacterium]